MGPCDQVTNDLQSITELLKSAGLALKTLSASQSPSEIPFEERKRAFESASNSYLKTLQTVDVGLRRQIYGLEEADILTPEKPKKAKEGHDGATGFGKAAPMVEPTIADGGMGKLDIGWLNSRSGRVGRDMEAELWEKAKTFLEGLEKEKSNGADDDHDEDMGT